MTPKDKLPLRMGERVRVFDVCKTTDAATSDTGTVVGFAAGVVKVQCDNWKNPEIDYTKPGIWFHKKQCRRLRPKKPKPVGAEMVERWVNVYKGCDPQGNAVAHKVKAEAEHHSVNSAIFLRCAHLLEVRNGECVVSRESLADAWDNLVRGMARADTSSESETFKQFCKALGLEGK